MILASLVSLPRPDVVERLLQDYRLEERAASASSSHWDKMHKSTVARCEVNERDELLLELKGHGFGNLQGCHPLQVPFEWLTSLFYIAILDRRTELIAGFRSLRRVISRLPQELRLKMTYDMLRQLFALHTLAPYLPKRNNLRFCLIGDGFGVLSALIKEILPDSKLTLIDLPKTLVFQSVYVQLMHPGRSHALLETSTFQEDFTYCPAPELPKDREFDVFINANSMQEMSFEVVASYFDFIRSAGSSESIFYCCNRLEKKLPDGKIIRFHEYPWRAGDRFLLDEICPYQKYFLNLKTLPRGPRLFGVRVPFLNAFDGEFWHRVAKLERDRLPDK